MLKTRKKVLMIPSWYPTKENPISGSFFKEQALELSKDFDFIVLNNYVIKKTSFSSFIMRILTKKLLFIKVFNKNYILPEITFRFYILGKGIMNIKILNKIVLKINKYIEKKYYKFFSQSLIKEYNFIPDLVYGMTAQVNGVMVAKLANFLNVPYVLAEHCPFPLQGTAIDNEKLNAINGADALLAISRDKIRQMLIHGVTHPQEYVGNMIDEDLFDLPSKSKSENHIFTILIVAAYNHFKDYDTFFNAISVLRESTKESFKLLIVGFSPIKDINEWNRGEEKFIELVNQYKLLDLCELIPVCSRNEIINYYHKSDVFVMTSIQEGMPVSSLEATACGLPVFATRCGGVEDFIDERNGKLVNIQDYKQLAYYLKEFLEGKVSYNPEEIRRITVERFGKAAFRSRINGIFNKVIDEYKSGED